MTEKPEDEVETETGAQVDAEAGAGVRTDVPFGLWPVMALTENVLATGFEEGDIDRNMLVANLAQFDDEQMPLVGALLERAALAASDVRSVLEHLLSVSRRNRVEVEWVRTAGAEADRRMREMIRLALSGPQTGRRFRRRRGHSAEDMVWSVRQILSLIQGLLCTAENGPRSIDLVLIRLRNEGIDRRALFLQAVDLVILMFGLALEELRIMMTLPREIPPPAVRPPDEGPPAKRS